MKKITFMVAMLATASGFCQYPSIDDNWEIVLNEEFTGDRYWKDNRIDNTGTIRAYFSECGVTHDKEKQVYTRENAIFRNETLVLKAEYKPNTTNFWTGGYDDTYYNSYDYLSGAIEFLQPFKYGYFEIRCKLPKANKGNFPAFWLWSYGSRYNEIDIFEHTDPNEFENRNFTGGYYTHDAHGRNTVNYYLSAQEQPLTDYHTYAVKWLPNYCAWYFDGRVMREISCEPEIPNEVMLLKVNYALKDYTKGNGKFPLEMVVDYVKVYKLKCDCQQSITLGTNAQINSYKPSVKKNIRIKGISPLKLTKDLSLIATDEVSIESDFEVPLGKELNIEIVQCPE